MYNYVKAIHIIFIVTWFAGLFYMPRLMIYSREAADKSLAEKEILQAQFSIMQKRLWLGITWPSAILTIIFGGWMAYLYGVVPEWLWIKLGFVSILYAYHFYMHKLYREQQKNFYRWSSQQLRIWNEIATILLVAIVMLVSVKQGLSAVWGLLGLVAFIGLLLLSIRLYKALRN